MKRLLLIGSAALFSCSGAAHQESGIKVTKAEFGEDWPLTVNEGYVDCLGYKEVVFRIEGAVYSLNGQAAGTKKYLPVDPIWRDDPRIEGAKISISPLIKKGLDICK